MIKSHVKNIYMNGTRNKIDGLDPNCKIDFINLWGMNNEIDLNQNCSNLRKSICGFRNKLIIGGNVVNDDNINNRYIDYSDGNRVIRGGNIRVHIYHNNNNDNEDNNSGNNNGGNNNGRNNNGGNNNGGNNMNEGDEDNLEQFSGAKKKIILEMDEYQYKHIQKYDSRKETKCSICLEDFKSIDIIKAFYKCEHIFHKTCLLCWLKKSDLCPLCKHNLNEDMQQFE